MKSYRIAILIADIEDATFKDIKMHMKELIWNDSKPDGIDVYYIKGMNLNKFQRMRVNWIERLRYSRFWYLQYGYDYLAMYRYRFLKPKSHLVSEDIHVDVPEGLSHLTIKMLAGLELLEKLEYDFVFRTTLSTVINFELLQRYTNTLGVTEEKYAGYLVDFNTHPFISGSSTLVNRKAIRMLIENRHKLNFARLDDVAIGRVFEDLITPVSLPHLNINSSKEVEQLLQRDMKEVLSFRCKTDTLPRSDWQIAQQVIRKLQNQR
jgi:hypothetical protein